MICLWKSPDTKNVLRFRQQISTSFRVVADSSLFGVQTCYCTLTCYFKSTSTVALLSLVSGPFHRKHLSLDTDFASQLSIQTRLVASSINYTIYELN